MTERIEPYGEPVDGTHPDWASALAAYHLHDCPDPATCTHAFEFRSPAGNLVRRRGMDLDTYPQGLDYPLDRGDA